MPRKLLKSFICAKEGLLHALSTQRNISIQLGFGCFALMGGIVLSFSFLELAVLVLAIFFVVVSEMFNTALEEVVNAISPHPSVLAKIAKDVAAGATLMSAVAALIIGLLLFAPKIVIILSLGG